MPAFESPRVSIPRCNLSSIEIFPTVVQMSQIDTQKSENNKKYIAKNIYYEKMMEAFFRLYVRTQRLHNIVFKYQHLFL